MLRDHPVFGAGINAYQSTMAPYRAVDAYNVPEPYAHNIVLTTWSELGLLGLLAFIYILGALIVRPWPALKKASDFYRPLLWGLGTGFVMLAVHGLVDSPYWKNDLSLEFWLLAALEVVALRAVNATPSER
jgi:O-antigen ligase